MVGLQHVRPLGNSELGSGSSGKSGYALIVGDPLFMKRMASPGWI